jgi:hypothetical protein
MTIVAKACVIIHNMIVSQRKEEYKGNQTFRLSADEVHMPTEVHLNRSPETRCLQAQFWRGRADGCVLAQPAWAGRSLFDECKELLMVVTSLYSIRSICKGCVFTT